MWKVSHTLEARFKIFIFISGIKIFILQNSSDINKFN